MNYSVRLLFVTWGLALTNLWVTAVDPGEDFAGYMENLEQRREDEESYRAKLSAHEVCKRV